MLRFLTGESNEISVAAMAMVEGINQPKITPKRIKVAEIVKGVEDRISALPDGLLVEILSRLPDTKRAIRTGTLSKRWKYLWTLIPTLIFENYNDKIPRFYFFSSVDKTLTQCRQLKLRKIEVCTTYDIRFESYLINWIRYAISCNVEELDLTLVNSDSEAVFPFIEHFSTNSCFTDLRLAGCIFNNPTGAISWKRLRRLNICYGNLDEDMIENILSGSPLLETLVLDTCRGYSRLDITSKSVKNLVFSGYWDPNQLTYSIKINAPNILSLTIEGGLWLQKLLLSNVSSLVEANLDYKKYRNYTTTPKEAEEEMLKGFIQSLRHVKELKIGPSCSKVLFRLEAKGFIFPSNVKFPGMTDSVSDLVGNSDWETYSDNDPDESSD